MNFLPVQKEGRLSANCLSKRQVQRLDRSWLSPEYHKTNCQQWILQNISYLLEVKVMRRRCMLIMNLQLCAISTSVSRADSSAPPKPDSTSSAAMEAVSAFLRAPTGVAGSEWYILVRVQLFQDQNRHHYLLVNRKTTGRKLSFCSMIGRYPNLTRNRRSFVLLV